MTQQEWDAASDEERKAEIEKCRTDAHYCYMKYFWKEGMKTYTKEGFDSIQGFIHAPTRRIRRFNPLTEPEAFSDKIEWKKPDNRSYDGHAHKVYWEDPEIDGIPIRLAFEKPELYQQLLKQREEMMAMWQKAFPLTGNAIPKGKIIFTTLFDDDKKANNFKSLWENSDPSESKLKRFFKPQYKSKP